MSVCAAGGWSKDGWLCARSRRRSKMLPLALPGSRWCADARGGDEWQNSTGPVKLYEILTYFVFSTILL